MTELPPVPRTSNTLPRRLGWLAIACSAAALAVNTAAWIAGESVGWTTWANPLLGAAWAEVLLLGGLDRRPRLVWPFLVVGLGLTAAVIVSEALAFIHR